MRVIRRIKEVPSEAEVIKMKHFANVGFIEVFLESVPIAFILVLLTIVGLGGEEGTSGLCSVLIGSRSLRYISDDYWSFTLFCITCATSTYSAGFGMAR